MKAIGKVCIATAVCMALSGSAWAHSTNGNGGGNGNGNSGNGNSAVNLINMPQIAPLLIERGSRSQLTPVVSQKLPIADNPGNRIGTLKTPDLKNDKAPDVTRKDVLTKVNDKSDKEAVLTKVGEKADRTEKETETLVAAADDASGARKAETYQPACR